MKSDLDVSDFRQMLLDSPKQFKEGFALAQDIRVPGEFEAIMISGMGGSALPGNLFRIYLNDLFRKQDPEHQPLAIYQNRSYNLPPESFRKCLNLICSYSGNTEETVSSFEEALKYNLPCIGFSSGGKIEELCKQNNVPHIKLPVPFPNFQPRIGTGYFFGAMFQVLVNQGLVPDMTGEIVTQMENIERLLPKIEAEGKKLAQELVGKTPVVYATTKYKSVAMVWKIKLNENAKTPAFWNFFPELNHNEMVGFTLPQGKFFILMLRDPKTHPNIFKRFEVTATLLRKTGVDVKIIDMEGESVFEKIFTTILLGDFTSYYLALEYGIDPTPVEMVEELKKLLTC
ncbi:MAG: bifunctional phosphoglucose/phosphomannose isomerase [Candidatus Moranbacteria bacterium]|nr:bifunctional phosphoglucose/phosphomannose isomerase [Candidatus Moranbacteria bacterium]